MPTYEKRADDGTVLERTVTLPAGHPSGYDEQMAALAAADGIPWHLVDEHQAAVSKPVDAPLATGGLISAEQAAATGAALGADRHDQPFAHDDLKTEEV
jgi:hypothetical protein